MIALINQTASYTVSGGSTTKTVTIPAPTAGNTLVFQGADLESSTQIVSVKQGTTAFTKQAAQYGVSNFLETWSLANCGSGTTINVVVTATYGQRVDLVVSEWSAMPAAAVLDGSAGNTQTTSTVTTSTITPAAAGPVLVVAHAMAISFMLSGPPGNGFTEFSDSSGTVNRAAFAYKILTAGAATFTSWAKSASYGACDMLICGFDGTAGAPAGGLLNRRRRMARAA